MNDFITSMMGASKRIVGTVADAGAKTMLKTDMAFLERDIKSRKQSFGIVAYDILYQSSNNNISGIDAVMRAYEECHNDIGALEKKLATKRGEWDALNAIGGSGGGTTTTMSSSAGVGEDAEAPGIPQNP